MEIKKNTPMVITKELTAVKQFYCDHFGFKPTFDSDEYVGLQSGDKSCELSFMKPCADDRPGSNDNIMFCFEVDDVDAEHDRLRGRDIQVVQPPTDNPWGDRSAIALDPIGIKLYIYKAIEPTSEYKKYIKE